MDWLSRCWFYYLKWRVNRRERSCEHPRICRTYWFEFTREMRDNPFPTTHQVITICIGSMLLNGTCIKQNWFHDGEHPVIIHKNCDSWESPQINLHAMEMGFSRRIIYQWLWSSSSERSSHFALPSMWKTCCVDYTHFRVWKRSVISEYPSSVNGTERTHWKWSFG